MSRYNTPEIRDKMIADYLSGMSGHAVARKYGRQPSGFYNLLDRRGIPRRKGGAPVRDGRSSRDGYSMVNVNYAGEMAKAMSNGLSQGRYVLEHRLLMAEALGRPLAKYETVHHINGDRADNRLENLQLRIGQHGNGRVARCADCGSCNVVFDRIADQ